ncbi:MAG: rRNA maturation RNase YbeY [Oscillospiraceae bacterium]|nr:rRNA maturation RNase YbeY [Oscillospiraceae bacterium]
MSGKYTVYLSRKRGVQPRLDGDLIKRAVCVSLKAENVDAPCEVSVYITDDEEIHGLNLKFRGADKPTDVLSFPMQELAAGAFRAEDAERDPDTGRIALGDVMISAERAKAQGDELGHGADREAAYLTVHSVLHLLGYDHVDEGAEKRKMRAREKAIMALLDLDE